jgi:hypothetical protein
VKLVVLVHVTKITIFASFLPSPVVMAFLFLSLAKLAALFHVTTTATFVFFQASFARFEVVSFFNVLKVIQKDFRP